MCFATDRSSPGRLLSSWPIVYLLRFFPLPIPLFFPFLCPPSPLVSMKRGDLPPFAVFPFFVLLISSSVSFFSSVLRRIPSHWCRLSSPCLKSWLHRFFPSSPPVSSTAVGQAFFFSLFYRSSASISCPPFFSEPPVDGVAVISPLFSSDSHRKAWRSFLFFLLLCCCVPPPRFGFDCCQLPLPFSPQNRRTDPYTYLILNCYDASNSSLDDLFSLPSSWVGRMFPRRTP